MAGSTTTTLNDLLPQIVAEAMFVASERSVMRGLVRNFNLAPGQGKTVTVPIYPAQTAAAYTEGNENPIANTAVSTDGATLTVTTAAIRTLVSDLAVASAASNVVADLGRLFGEAIARKIDTDLTGLFVNFNAEGNGATPISAADVFKAVAKLKALAVPTDGMVCVLHPEIAYDLKSALTTPNTSVPFSGFGLGEVSNEAIRMGYIGQLAGIPVIETANMNNTGNAGDFMGAVFHRDALGLAMIGDIGIEVNRRPEFLGTDVIGYCHYGVGSIYNNYGRGLNFDSSINPAA